MIELYEELPLDVLEGVQWVHEQVFEGSRLKPEKLIGKLQLFVLVYKVEQTVAGFKIGYEQEDGVFYSWLGGVHPQFQGRGIASALMRMQHEEARKRGYKRIRTYSQNHRKAMMITNLKHGFDIVGTFIDAKGRFKIVFEKDL